MPTALTDAPVVVREVRSGGSAKIVEGERCLNAAPSAPLSRHYVVLMDGRRHDSFLKRDAAMRTTRALAKRYGVEVRFEPNTLVAFRPPRKGAR